MAGNPNQGQPYYDPQRGFVYLQSNDAEPAAPAQHHDDDDQNLDEIERELYRTGSHESMTSEQHAAGGEGDHKIMAQLEEEMLEEDKRVYTQSKNDRHILQQTWYPESRDCSTCQGFKYASQFGSGQCPDCDPNKPAPAPTGSKAYVVEEG